MNDTRATRSIPTFIAILVGVPLIVISLLFLGMKVDTDYLGSLYETNQSYQLDSQHEQVEANILVTEIGSDRLYGTLVLNLSEGYQFVGLERPGLVDFDSCAFALTIKKAKTIQVLTWSSCLKTVQNGIKTNFTDVVVTDG